LDPGFDKGSLAAVADVPPCCADFDDALFTGSLGTSDDVPALAAALGGSAGREAFLSVPVFDATSVAFRSSVACGRVLPDVGWRVFSLRGSFLLSVIKPQTPEPYRRITLRTPGGRARPENIAIF
jgi:hypothetical protein